MSARQALYPVTLDLRRSGVLVVGAGTVALRKLKGLPLGVPSIKIVAPQVSPAVRSWILRHGQAKLLRRGFKRTDLAGSRILFCCTGDPKLNGGIADLARAKGLWVCQVSDPGQGDLQVPAVARVAGLQMTLSTGGASPALAGALRSHFEKSLRSSDLQWLLKRLQGLRPMMKADPLMKTRLLKKLLAPAALAAILAPKSGVGRKRLEVLLKP